MSLILLLACQDSTPADTGWDFPHPSQLPDQAEPPDPFTGFDGAPVESTQTWESRRRPELLALFAH